MIDKTPPETREGHHSRMARLNPEIPNCARAVRSPDRISIAEFSCDLEINIPGGYAGKYDTNMTPYFHVPMQYMTDRRFHTICFVGSSQTGKALALETPIPTPKGWVTMGRIKVGDYVLSPEGLPTRVEFISGCKVAPQSFRVKFSHAGHIDCDANHEWNVISDKFLGVRTMNTFQLVSGIRAGIEYRIPVCQSGDIAGKGIDHMPLDPYVVGLWISCGQFNQFRFKSWDGSHVLWDIRRSKFSISEEFSTARRGVTVRKLTNDRDPDADFPKIMKKLQLYSSLHIPDCYLIASVKVRLRVLQGIVDGQRNSLLSQTASGNRWLVLKCSDTEMEEGIMQLLISLGQSPRRLEPDFVNTHSQSSIGVCLTRLSGLKFSRKPHRGEDLWEIDHQSLRDSRYSHKIESIEKIQPMMVKCIQVSHPSHLYLAGKHWIPTHNTQALVTNPLCHNIVCDPHDALVVQTTETLSKDYSERILGRMIEVNPKVKSAIRGNRGNMTYTKRTKAGAMISLGWPTPAMFAGRSMRSLFITDLDRKPTIKEGAIYLLGLNRIKSFLTRGKVVVESTPSVDLGQNEEYLPKGHEAPNVEGIFTIYNQGTMHRWYMPCTECGDMFMANPNFEGFWIPPEKKGRSLAERCKGVCLVCTSCGGGIPVAHQKEVTRAGVWVGEGQTIDGMGEVSGEEADSRVASFWLPGHAAAFQDWSGIMLRYLSAVEVFETTGNSSNLKVSLNTDFGCVFQLPRNKSNIEDVGDLIVRAEVCNRGECPDWTTCVTITIDVQIDRFVVQIIAWGQFAESQIIDRYNLRISPRINTSTGKPYPMNPGIYLEDWAVIKSELMGKKFYTKNKEFEFTPVAVGCDSMGYRNTSVNIMQFYEQLRSVNLHTNFCPVRGDGNLRRKNVTSSFLSERQVKKKNSSVHNVPLLVININALKDEFFANLSIEAPGANYIHFGDWTPDWLYAELISEVRGADARYVKKKKRTNNEALDLYIYARALLEHRGYFRIDWRSPPYWCRPRKVENDEKKSAAKKVAPGRVDRSGARG